MKQILFAVALLLAAPLLPAPSKPILKPLIDQTQIARKIQETAHKIDNDYQGKDLIIVMVMKGAVFTVADLMRAIEVPADLEFVQCKSYHGTERGNLTITGLEALQLKGRDVLIIDDIFDSGHTMSVLRDAVLAKAPRSVKTLVLLYKKNAKHVTDLRPDYALFEIGSEFVVGYGLDFDQHYRGLPGIYLFEEPR